MDQIQGPRFFYTPTNATPTTKLLRKLIRNELEPVAAGIKGVILQTQKYTIMGKNIYILSCTANKAEGSLPAKELYTGQLFVNGLQYARRHNADKILVIGGVCKSEVFDLDDVVKTYDGINIEKLRKPERLKLAKKRLANIIAKGCSAEDDTFMFLTGQHYYEFILAGKPQALPGALQHCKLPFLEHHLKGIGDINHFLRNN